MTVGYDSGDVRPARFIPAHSRKWLDDIRAHSRNHQWLREHNNTVYHVIRQNYLYNGGSPQDATRTLLSILRVMLTGGDYHRWWQLYWEATLEAGKRHDYLLLNEINANFGQAFLIKGDLASARHLFISVIDDSKHAQRGNEFEIAEQRMLAYIGLIKAETWDYSGEYVTPQLIADALALAKRLGDRLLSDLLYQALAAVYAHRGQTAEALGYSLTSLGYASVRGDQFHAAITGIVLASAYRKAALYQEAEHALTYVHRLLERIDHPQAAGLAAYESGVVAYYRGNYALSETWVYQAQRIFESLAFKHQITMTTHMLGNIAVELQQYERASERLTRALENWRIHQNIYEQTSVLYDLGDLHFRIGDRQAAQQHMDAALALSASIPKMNARDWLIGLIHDFRAKLADDDALPLEAATPA